jgi:hypothetical protein
VAGNDIRIPVSFINHRKRKKLERNLGKLATSHLIDLWLNAAMNHPSGILDGMTEEDIALDANWDGDEYVFVTALIDVGFIDVDDNRVYSLHDWEKHQPWVYNSEERSKRARKAVQARWKNEKKTENIRRVYEPYTECNTPSPSPLPLPLQTTYTQKQDAKIQKFKSEIQEKAIQVINSWNEATGGNIRIDPPTGSHVEQIRKNISKDSNWLSDALEAAALVKNVDDSGWTTGKVSFSWFIRFDTPGKVLADGYPLKKQASMAECIDFEEHMKKKASAQNG